jgi:hypothetical protein
MRPRPFRHQKIRTNTVYTFTLMNKGIFTARSDVQCGNHTPHKKITQNHQAARIYTFWKG